MAFLYVKIKEEGASTTPEEELTVWKRTLENGDAHYGKLQHSARFQFCLLQSV